MCNRRGVNWHSINDSIVPCIKAAGVGSDRTPRFLEATLCALKVTTAQAESALSHIAATEVPDEDDGDAVDDEIIAEMEALVGLDVNPSMLDYACHALDLRQYTQLQLEDVGWPAIQPVQSTQCR